MADTIEISVEEYEQLTDDSKLLGILVANGIDNWEGWEPSLDEWNEL